MLSLSENLVEKENVCELERRKLCGFSRVHGLVSNSLVKGKDNLIGVKLYFMAYNIHLNSKDCLIQS